MKGFFQSGMHWQLFNFGLFVAILFVYLKKPVGEYWRSRAHKISFEMEEAKRLRKEAGKRTFDLEERYNRLEKTMTDLVQSFQQEGELEKQKMIEESKIFSETLKKDASRIMEQEIKRVKEGFRRQAIQQSIEMAERLVRDSIRPEDQQKLRDHFLKDLEGRV